MRICFAFTFLNLSSKFCCVAKAHAQVPRHLTTVIKISFSLARSVDARFVNSPQVYKFHCHFIVLVIKAAPR